MKHSILKAIGYAILLLLLFLFAGLFFSWLTDTEETPVPISNVGDLERKREMGRHEKLRNVKSDPKSVLTQFSSDGCSGGLSAGWEYLADRVDNFQEIHGATPPWESCCVTHDRVYHTGGIRSATTTMSYEARRKADLRLKACVIETGKQRSPELMKEYNLSAAELEQLYKGIANLMYGAVRIGGLPCTDLSWRWGYGWPECQ